MLRIQGHLDYTLRPWMDGRTDGWTDGWMDARLLNTSYHSVAGSFPGATEPGCQDPHMPTLG